MHNPGPNAWKDRAHWLWVNTISYIYAMDNLRSLLPPCWFCSFAGAVFLATFSFKKSWYCTLRTTTWHVRNPCIHSCTSAHMLSPSALSPSTIVLVAIELHIQPLLTWTTPWVSLREPPRQTRKPFKWIYALPCTQRDLTTLICTSGSLLQQL